MLIEEPHPLRSSRTVSAVKAQMLPGGAVINVILEKHTATR